MNSRSSVNETNLVNFSTELSTINPIEAKEGLLTFSFDHIYACHSESVARRQSIQLDKEVELAAHCVYSEEGNIVPPANSALSPGSDQLSVLSSQNKRLKELLIYHLDLIQQQNDLIIQKDKTHQALKQENETLKLKLQLMDKSASAKDRHSINPPPLVHVASSTVTSSLNSESSSASRLRLNNYTELLIPENRSKSIIFDTQVKQEPFEDSNSDQGVSSHWSRELNVLEILDNKDLNCQDYTMIENKSFVKKDSKTDRQEAVYNVSTGNSANPVIHRIQRSRRKTSTSSVNRMSKSSVIKSESPQSSKSFSDEKSYDKNYAVNKKSKMINTYGKSSKNGNQKKTLHFGSLSERLQLIDTTPTGEDPYQMGEADLREQSPIPKLMLQKTHQGGMRICTSDSDGSISTRTIYDPKGTQENKDKNNKLKYNLSQAYSRDADSKKHPKVEIVHEPDLDIVKTEPGIDWRIYTKTESDNSLCDYSYGGNPNNITSHILDNVEFQEFFTTDSPIYHSEEPRNENCNIADKNNKKIKRGGRTMSLVVPPNHFSETEMPKPDIKRARKRALSTTTVMKAKKDKVVKTILPKPKPESKPRAPCRGRRSPVPGVNSRTTYNTLVGDADLSWYYGLDPDIKYEDLEQTGPSVEATVEVPRWREKIYTSCYSLEGTENLDDKVFEKRHQKLEAEERRQLRWHMRRVREQRHVERLRQRQRDSWCSTSQAYQPTTYTIWPQPLRDVHYIEITDTLPVNAFGEELPAIPERDFKLPWIRTPKAHKRNKRSKTLL